MIIYIEKNSERLAEKPMNLAAYNNTGTQYNQHVPSEPTNCTVITTTHPPHATLLRPAMVANGPSRPRVNDDDSKTDR